MQGIGNTMAMTEELLGPHMQDVPDEFWELSRRVQENLAFEAHHLGTTVKERMAKGVHKIWLELGGPE